MLYYFMSWFDSSDFVIHDIDPIWYHRNPIYTIVERFNISVERFNIPMGLNPEFFFRNLREIEHNKDYGSKYSRIYCYCTVYSSSYCFFTYNLCKNGK